jgi:protein-S-isoprenylcysteine O-methyltransferase Ste14
MNKNDREKEEKGYEYTVHHVLAGSYSFYFFLLILGVVFDFAFPFKIFNSSLMSLVGLCIIVFASILIMRAQMFARAIRKEKDISVEAFCRGPYCYTRSPTHWGLFLLILGFGIMINSLFVIVFTILSLVVTKLFFLKKEESILVKKYGAPYEEYKKLVKF